MGARNKSGHVKTEFTKKLDGELKEEAPLNVVKPVVVEVSEEEKRQRAKPPAVRSAVDASLEAALTLVTPGDVFGIESFVKERGLGAADAYQVVSRFMAYEYDGRK